MSKFKVGDKVRILDVDAIMFGRDYFSNGDITEVVGYFEGDVNQPDLAATNPSCEGLTMYIDESEYPAIEKVEDAGDRHHDLVDEIEKLKRRVSELEAKEFNVERVSQELTKALEKEDARLAEISRTIDVDKLIAKTPNERRKEAIEKAREFVKRTEELADDNPERVGNSTLRRFRTRVEYVINEEKRTVVVLAYGKGTGNLYGKGIAKCAPDDVFNVDLGKAIALGRAYGLDVSEFEQAPQPDEVVVGMVVDALCESDGSVTESGIEVVGILPISGYPKFADGMYASHYRIISDTEAKY